MNNKDFCFICNRLEELDLNYLICENCLLDDLNYDQEQLEYWSD